MAKLAGIPKHEPTFNELMNIAQNAVMSRLNCHNIGKILEFDPDTQTCTIQVMQQKQFNEQIFTPAPITQVPLIIYGAGGSHITLPDPVGTICLLFFLDRNADAFMQTGEIYQPDTTRMHDFTDCIALTTFLTLNNPIKNYDTEAISIVYEKLVNEVLYNAVIKNYGNSIQLKVSTEENISQVIVSDKINVQNTSQSLAALIQELIADIKALTVNTQTGAVMQATIDSLDQTAQKFTELLN